MSDRQSSQTKEAAARVEAQLRRHPAVADAAVLVRADRGGAERLVAYVQPSGATSAERLREQVAPFLSGRSPDDWVAVTALPYGGDGRLNVGALEGVAVLDDVVQQQCEAALAQAVGPDQAVALRVQRQKEDAALSLSDFGLSVASARSRTTVCAAAASADAPAALSEGVELRVEADAPRTLAQALLRAADRFGDHTIRHVDAQGGERVTTYAELLAEAQRVQAGLIAAGLTPGDKILLQLENTSDFLAGFWGCVLAGVVPAPLTIPSSYELNNGTLRKLRHAWTMFDRCPVLAGPASTPRLQAIAEPLGCEGLRVISIDDLRRSAPAAEPHAAKPDDRALLLLTSGSSGAPKAVTHPHHTLIARSLATAQHNGHNSDDVSLNWMPLDHVGGIVMFHLRDVVTGAHQVQVATDHILEQPLRWLDLMQQHGVSATWAPNFAFALVNDALERDETRQWDLSTVRFVLNGGEAIVPATARRFLELLEPHGLSRDAMKPSWGMSETSSGVTFNRDLTLEKPEGFAGLAVEVGQPIPGVAVRIVDQNGGILREGEEGRLQIRGVTITPGYYNNPERNAEAFTSDGWFNTGDLGVLRAGSLTITGREKEELIINGVNFAVSEIEAVVDSLAGVVVACTAACAVRRPADDTDELAIFFTPEGSDDDDLRSVIQSIRQQLMAQLGLAPSYLVPLPAERIPKTAIGKIQRAALRRSLSDGEFDSILAHVEHVAPRQDGLPNWFFKPSWQPRAIRAGSEDRILPRHALIVSDATGISDRLASDLAACGVKTATTSSAEVVRWLGEVRPDLVIDCRACDGEADLAGTLALVQAVAAHATDEQPIRLCCIATDSQAVDASDAPTPQNAAVPALLRAAAAEVPALRVQHIDLPAGSTAEQVSSLANELLSGPHSDIEVAYRGGLRLVPRLKLCDARTIADNSTPVVRGGVYAITGGLGGVGMHLARYLLNHWGVKLLLLGRRAAEDPKVRDRLASLQSQGDVLYVQVNVADAAAVCAALDQTGQHWNAEIAGVFHLAGRFHETSILAETPEALADAFDAKVNGAIALHNALAQRGGGRLVLFGSVNGYFSGRNVAAYAAANRALATFARARAAGPVRTVCLDWSMWADTGMSRGYALAEASAAAGYAQIQPAQGLASLQIALRLNQPNVLIGLDGNNPRIATHLATTCEAVEELLICAATDDVQPPKVVDRFGTPAPCRIERLEHFPRTSDGSPDRTALLELAGFPGMSLDAAPRNDLERQIARIFQDVLGLMRISIHESFLHLGGDSLKATQIVSRLRNVLAVPLALRDLFENQTVAALAESVANRDNAAADVITREDVVALDAEALSDEEVEAALAQMLSEEEHSQ